MASRCVGDGARAGRRRPTRQSSLGDVEPNQRFGAGLREHHGRAFDPAVLERICVIRLHRGCLVPCDG
jgi:hypothetical protein